MAMLYSSNAIYKMFRPYVIAPGSLALTPNQLGRTLTQSMLCFCSHLFASCVY